jgi:hypothetical protein
MLMMTEKYQRRRKSLKSLDKYSDPPNTEPRSVVGFDLMAVPDIRISDHSKTGRRV